MNFLKEIIGRFNYNRPEAIIENKEGTKNGIKYDIYEKSPEHIEYREIDLESNEQLAIERVTKDNMYYVLNKAMAILASNLGFDETAQNIVDVMVNSMGYRGGVLFLVKEKENCLQSHTYSLTSWTKIVVKKLPFKTFRDIKLPLDTKNDLLVDVINKRKIYIAKGISPFIKHLIPWQLAKWIDNFTKTNYAIAIPVILRNNVAGIININSTYDFTNEEIEMLRNFAKQVSIAIYNSRQYEQIKSNAKHLQEKTEDMEALLSLSQTSSSGPEIETNIQTMMDIVPEKLGYLEILGAVLVRYDEKIGKVYAYITTESDLVQRAKKILSKSALNDYAVFVAKDGENSRNLTLTSQSILSGEIKRGENLTDFISPPVERPKAWLMQKMMGGKSFVAVPINIRGEKLGAVIFMFRKQLSQIGDRDIDILKAFSQQIGVIIENLQFYQSLNKNIEELIRTKDNLEETLTMKNEFLRIVSHQLRTPLTAVRGLISMWKDGDFDNLASVKMSEVKTRVANNIERLNNIINDMIKAMESEGDLKLKFAPTSIERILKNSVGILKSNFERKGLYIKYKKFIKEIPEIEADEKSLNHVFINLIDNAEKYTERGGLEITVYREEDNVYVRLSDTGVGLSDEDKEALFKKFSRGQDSGRLNPGGSGLGLFIVKQILDEHHGKIKVSSLERGKGTTFVVSLPVKQPKPDLRV
ncbi:GAF domain-containing protein [Patescibacteria group bacterium]|nr:GAF domain-containing protein [Patescibacteria group bacterium]